MQKIGLILIFVLLYLGQHPAQTNLVINPGFEETNYSSTGTRELRKAGYLSNYWYCPIDKQSPQLYMIPDRNVAKANSGFNAIGMVLGGAKQEKNKIEYITGELQRPLVSGQAYCVSFYLLLHRSSKWGASDLGVLFHQDRDLMANVGDAASLNPGLSVNNGDYVTNTKWMRFNGYYVASGGEKYITFGSFGNGASVELTDLGLEPYFQVDGLANKAYYQLDDVSVIARNGSEDCGCAEPPKEENVEMTEQLQPYLFALDASGSMKKGGVFDSLRSNLKELLEQLPVGTPVTFSTFSSSSSLIYSGKLKSGTASEIDSLLSGIELKGGTSVFSGLQNASKSWDQGKDSARIVLISDGSFTVTNNIESLVKNQYESKGRRLTVIQIASKAKDAERLEPYETVFVSVELSELKYAIYKVYNTGDFNAIACECINAYADTMNYHFVIDYSGSMKLNRGRAKNALLNLYEQAPATAVISVTAFSETATELYVGKKSEVSSHELEAMLESHNAQGGTDPTPGVDHGLNIAQNMAEDRFSHLIIITDLSADQLNEKYEMKDYIQNMSEKIDLAVSSATVDLSTQLDVLMSGRAQYDITTGIFRDVSKNKFEKDLFDTKRSSCDYTTQPYHYNPATDITKDVAKQTLRLVLREMLNAGISAGN